MSAFALLAACCHWPRTPQTIDAIGKAAVAMDWPHFMRLATFHRVVGMAHDGLNAAGASPPEPVAQTLAAAATSIARNGLKLAAETVRLQKRLDGAGIPSLALKGAALGQRVYATVGLKESKDIDLYVSRGDAMAAIGLLEREGFAVEPGFASFDLKRRNLVFDYIKEFPLYHAGKGVQVDISWRTANNERLMTGLSASSPGQTIALPGGGGIRTLTDDDMLIYLGVHGASHTWSRLKWLADLHALLRTFAPSDLPRLQRLARERGSDVCLAQAILLCERVFGYPPPEPETSAWRGGGRLTYLADAAEKWLTAPPQANLQSGKLPGVAHLRLYNFLLGRGPTFLMEQCRIMSVQALDVAILPLPSWLFFLYPILRIPLYFWRWLGRLRKT